MEKVAGLNSKGKMGGNTKSGKEQNKTEENKA